MNLDVLARRCLRVRNDGTAPWSDRPLEVAELAGLLRLLASRSVTDGPGQDHVPWEERDDELLLDLWRSGSPVVEVAARLGRSDGAVRTRIAVLRRRGCNVPHRIKVPQRGWGGHDA